MELDARDARQVPRTKSGDDIIPKAESTAIVDEAAFESSRPTWRSRRSLIEIEESTETRLTSHTTRHLDHRRAEDQAIADSLMISFGVVVRDALRHGASKVPLADRNQPVQAFVFDRPHEALRVGVRVRRARRSEDEADTGLPQPASHRDAEGRHPF